MTDRKLCPREPTQEMLDEGRGAYAANNTLGTLWRAMYDAAPAPEPPAPPDVAGLIARLRTQARAKDAEDAAAALEAMHADLKLMPDVWTLRDLRQRAEQAERELAAAREALRTIANGNYTTVDYVAVAESALAAIDAARKGVV